MSITNDTCNDFYENVLPTLYKHAPSNEYILFCYAFLILADCFCLLCIFGYLYYWNRYPRLRMTNRLLKVTGVGAMMTYTSLIIIREIIGRANFSCRVFICLYHMCMFFAAGPMVGNFYVYIYKLRKEREVGSKILDLMHHDHKHTKRIVVSSTNYNNNGDDEHTNHDVSTQIEPYKTGHHGHSHENEKKSSFIIDFIKELVGLIFILRYSKNGKIVVSASKKISKNEIIHSDGDDKSVSDISQSEVSELDASLFRTSSSQSQSNFIKTWKDVIYEEIIIPVFLLFTFSSSVLIFVIYRFTTDPLLIHDCYGCKVNLEDFLIRIVYAGFFAIAICSALYALRNEEDVLGVFSELKFNIATAAPFVVYFICAPLDPNALEARYILIWDYLFIVSALAHSYSMTLRHVVLEKLERRKHRYRRAEAILVINTEDPSDTVKKTTKNVDASMLDIRRIFNEPKVRNALLEHSVNEISSENVVFAIKVQTWKSIYEKETVEKVTQIAINLFNEYINRNSKSAINISNNAYMRFEKDIEPYLQAAISSNDVQSSVKLAKPPKTIFDECEKECLLIIETDTLPRFINSSLFKERVIESNLLGKIYAL